MDPLDFVSTTGSGSPFQPPISVTGDFNNPVTIPTPVDIVNAPPHYSRGKFQVWDIIEHFRLNYNIGNVAKYILRAGKKTDSPIEDYKKAIAYLQREVDILEGKIDVRPK